MKKYTLFFLWTIVSIILVTSCVTYQPIASQISDADYNKRITINKPNYKKKANALGFTVSFGLPIAGAAIGYAVDPVVTVSDEEGRKGSPIAGAAIGALAGTGLTYLTNSIMKYNNVSGINNEKAWVKKAFGKNYNIIETSKTQYRIVHKSAENCYIVNNFDDVKDFAKAFPNSQYADNVVKQALEKVTRDQLPFVLELFPQTNYTQNLKDRYIKESTSYEKLAEALKKYPNTELDVENLFVNKILYVSEALDFYQRFPNSKQKGLAVYNAFQCSGSIEEIRKLRATYGDAFNLSKSTLIKAPESIKKNYYVGIRDLQSFMNMSQLNEFENNYEWLLFKGKDTEIISNAWNLADKNYSKGLDVIAQAGKVVGKSYAQKANVTFDAFKSFVNNKMSEQIDHITVESVDMLSSKSEEFEKWKKSAYSAGLVRKADTLQFLVYGQVKNPSKFDIPVSLFINSGVYQTNKIEKGGLLGGLINVLGAITNVPLERAQKLGDIQSKSFYIPSLQANQSMPFAILLEFKDMDFNGLAGGINLMDMIKVSGDIVLSDTKISIALADNANIPKGRLEEQTTWLQMASNGLPEAKAMDLFRNQQYSQSTWDDEWDKILKEASRSSGYSSSSTSRDREESSNKNEESSENEDTKTHASKMYTCRVRLLHKDGSPINASSIHAEWDEGGGIFQNNGKGEFKVDNKGYAVITWPADEGDRVNYISYNESILPDWDRLYNLDLRNGEYYELNVDALKNKE